MDKLKLHTPELIAKSIKAIDKELNIAPLQYVVTAGEQKDETSYEEIRQDEGFVLRGNSTEQLATSVLSVVKYDIVGKIAEATVLTRRTVSRILTGINVAVCGQLRETHGAGEVNHGNQRL